MKRSDLKVEKFNLRHPEIRYSNHNDNKIRILNERMRNLFTVDVIGSRVGPRKEKNKARR